MRLVGREKLDEFSGAHADARSWIENWIFDTEQARWRTPQDIKRAYASASFLVAHGGQNIVVTLAGRYYAERGLWDPRWGAQLNFNFLFP